MWIILVLMLLGIIVGRLYSGKKLFNLYIDKFTSYIIYLLLFFMGLSVGTNSVIMSQIKNLGLQALIISIFSIAGSIILAAIVYKLFYKDES